MTRPAIIVASLMRLDGATGVQTHMREFVAYLRGQGVLFELATPFHALTLPLLLGLVVVRQGLERLWKPGAVALYRSGYAVLLWLRLWVLMRRHASCVVYAQCPVSAAVALRVCRQTTHRVVLVVHFNVSQADEWIGKGMLARESWLDRRIRALEHSVLQRVHGMVFVSAFMRRKLTQIWPGVAFARSAIIPNFVKSLRDAEPLPGIAGRDLVNIGTLEPRKNQAFLLRVLAEARRRGRDLTLTLVGDGPDRARLSQLVQELSLQDLVHFAGLAPHGRDHIPGHRLYVHSAVMETQGIVLLEAMSAGVPVIAAHVGGIPEVFEEGQQGCFWPLDDVTRACDILLKLLDDEPGRRAMGQAAWLRFSERFDAAVAAGRLYEYLCETPPTGH